MRCLWCIHMGCPCTMGVEIMSPREDEKINIILPLGKTVHTLHLRASSLEGYVALIQSLLYWERLLFNSCHSQESAAQNT